MPPTWIDAFISKLNITNSIPKKSWMEETARQIEPSRSTNFKKLQKNEIGTCAYIGVGTQNSQPSSWPKAFNRLPMQGKTEFEDDAKHRKRMLLPTSEGKYRTWCRVSRARQSIINAVSRCWKSDSRRWSELGHSSASVIVMLTDCWGPEIKNC